MSHQRGSDGDKISLFKAYRQHCDVMAQKETYLKKVRGLDLATFRIATYNVHYWTDLNEKANLEGVFCDIKRLDADILCLQEVSFGTTQLGLDFNYLQLMAKFRKLGYIDSIEVYGSRYLGSRFGNMILSRHKLTNKSLGILPLGNVTKVKRGYCYASVNINGNATASTQLDICCVHLDVFDETGRTRQKQIRHLIKALGAPRPNLIICGDFNAVRARDYTPEQLKKILDNDLQRGVVTDTHSLHELEKISYQSVFDDDKGERRRRDDDPPLGDFTVWSNRMIDFIWLHREFPLIRKHGGSGILHTTQSDHCALYMDLETNPLTSTTAKL